MACTMAHCGYNSATEHGHFLDIIVAFLSQTCLKPLSLLSSYNALHSAHISSDYANNLFRI